ncbi:hypothetical protein JIG36_05170 [Actinoplanes sp. LDG1-06]|uniref:Uncharacterized protein n=1 Tax=Paractinoplanes ovalisporus TaxID=2810368 RepID=A0ABS2A548_9ACTN|nr:hypothetical protein [Actinoplanes ovalisporus]MBM2614949.1 hypothetical protein [Actinoplanes ovalisporus]
MLTAGCGSASPEEGAPLTSPPAVISAPPSMSVPPVLSPPAKPVWSLGPWTATTRPTTTTAGGDSKRVSEGWEITVYYTAVEKFHDGDPTDVTGCLKLDCANGDDELGTYPDDFVQAVQDEGTGLTTAGKYLNWSYDIGYWLDSAPRSADGRRLEPFVSAAADPGVLPHGTRFTITGCGHQDDNSPLPATTCTALRRGSWLITDEFTPGLGGNRHIDAYIGPETGPDFTDSDWYVTLHDARLTMN